MTEKGKKVVIKSQAIALPSKTLAVVEFYHHFELLREGVSRKVFFK